MELLDRKQTGQTLIETALILFLLLLILLGITEFARAWFVKNTLKNAVRQGARVAAVTPRNNFLTAFNCINPTCPDANVIRNAVCCQPGVPKGVNDNTLVNLTCFNSTGTAIACNTIVTNGSVRITATSNFRFIIGDPPWPWPRTINMTAEASMRYE
jgi:hypothetical protein